MECSVWARKHSERVIFVIPHWKQSPSDKESYSAIYVMNAFKAASPKLKGITHRLDDEDHVHDQTNAINKNSIAMIQPSYPR